MQTGLKKEDSLALKGIAILMMVFYHCYYKTSKFAGYDVIFRGISREQVVMTASCMKICVALFAFVSGYGLFCGYQKEKTERKSEKSSEWIGCHLFSTLSGYWFVVVLSYIIYALAIDRSFGRLGDGRAERILAMGADFLGIANLMDVKSLNGAWWYMSAAVVFIFLVPCFYTVMKKWGDIVLCGIIFVFPRALKIGFPGGANVLSFMMIFAVGMICAEHDFFSWFHEFINKHRYSRLLTGMIMLVCISGAFWMYHKFAVKKIWEYQYAAVPFLVILFCVEFVFKIPHVSALFQYFGKHSLNIWLVHTFVRNYLGKFVYSGREFWLAPILVLVISLAASYVIEALKKVTGYQRMTRYVLQKMRCR